MHILFENFKKLNRLRIRDLAQWYKRLPGKYEVVNSIPGAKKKLNRLKICFWEQALE